MSLLGNWCKGEGLEPSHSIVVKLVPSETTREQIEETLTTIKALGRVRIRGRMFDPQSQSLMVLCECSERVNMKAIPLDVVPVGGGEPWTLHGPTESEETDIEGGFSPTEQESSPSDTIQGNSAESIIRAVGDLLIKTMRPNQESNVFRRLRTYSGTTPTPAGEENLDTWMEQAYLMVEECDCGPREKRKRIVESLKGPALEIAQAVRSNDPSATPEEYIQALERAFGTSETPEDLYFSFRTLRQCPGERLSDFLRRMERLLTKVVQKGGLAPTQRDSARVEQLIRGATESEIMLLQLRLRERKNSPPSFLTLLNEIREEEDQQSGRRKATNPVKSVVREVRVDHEESLAGHEELRAQICELRSEVTRLVNKPVNSTPEGKSPTPCLTEHLTKTKNSMEVQALKKQVEELQNQLTVMTVNSYTNSHLSKDSGWKTEYGDNKRKNNGPARPGNKIKDKPNNEGDDFFCYRCGEDGHVAPRCTAAEDSAKVIRKLIRSLRKLKVGNQEQTRQEKESSTTNCHVKQSAIDNQKATDLPEGLVGNASLETIIIEGHFTTALMDGGSTVSIIFESWYKAHLSHLPLLPLSSLALWGLSDSNYPYKGYVAVEVKFPGDGVQADPRTILALVCPDPSGPDQAPVIIGTNARRFCHEPKPQDCARGGNQAKSWRVCTQQPVLVETKNPLCPTDDSVGHIKWNGPGPITIPPGGTVTAACNVTANEPWDHDLLVIEAPALHPLPDGIVVPPCVLLPSDMNKNSFSVFLRNDTLKPRSISKGTVIAYVHKAEIVTELQKETMPSTHVDPALFNFGDSPIPSAWKERLANKLSERAGVFSLEDWDVGLAKGVEHTIRINDPRPFRERSRRLAPADIDDVRRHLQKLLAAGIIKESRSPYASPIVVARKKNGSIRMCIDYRTLNARTIPDQYTVPRIDDALDCMTGSRWFSVLDLRNGYYQIAMAETDKEKTAFICPLGFYQFERMPQGITGAPATFQRLMEKAVGDMNLLQCLVYLDDLIVFGRTLEEHEERLLKVLDRLQEYGLKLSIDKCQFCQPQVKYVGHIVSAEGIATDPEKIRAVTNWGQPTDLKSLQSFLGFCGYYRRFIANYSAIVKPLTDLTRGYLPAQKSKTRAMPQATYFKKAEPFGERWTPACTDAFQGIIQCLTHAPVLAFADPTMPYVLHVDASFDGLGAVLNQESSDGLRPVAFASRKLRNSEKNYPVHQLEFLALKWAVVDKFHDYLYGAKFTVRTDNNPLTYVLTTAKLNATGHRWLASLSTYDFAIQYRPGKENVDADLLSRNASSEEAGWIPPSGVKALCKRVSACGSPSSPVLCVDQLGALPSAIPDAYIYPVRLHDTSVEQLSSAEIQNDQDSDEAIRRVKQEIRAGRWPCSIQSSHAETCLLQREGEKLQLRKGLLHRRTVKPSGKEVFQLVLPPKHRLVVMQSLHDDFGHLGIEKTTDLIRNRFYWPKMAADIDHYIKTCGQCVARKTSPHKAAPLHQITSSGPMDLVCIDFLSIEPDSQGVANVLVVTDHFTRYAQAFPTNNQTAATVAKVLVEKFFVHYGLPSRIHSDQGRDFESRLIKELLTMLGIKKSRTTPYHPQGDAQPERFNRTLLSMLGTLEQRHRQKWSQHVSLMVHAYNNTRNEATGYSPYYLMFGREARLPIDLCFGLEVDGDDTNTHHQYVEKLRQELRHAYQLASEASKKSHQRNKRRYDNRVRVHNLQEGDRVLVRALGIPGKHKLKEKWDLQPYVVLGKLPNLPVYRLKPESGKGIVKTLHRDHLLPIGFLVRMPTHREETNPSQRPSTRASNAATQKRATGREGQSAVNPLSGSESEDEDSHISSAGLTHRDWATTLSHIFPSRNHSDDGNNPSTDTVEDACAHDYHPSEEELPDPVCVAEEDKDAVAPTSEDPVADTGMEGGDVPPTSESNDEVEPVIVHTAKRAVKPVIRLSYDEPGKSTDQPIVIVHRGMKICIIMSDN